MTESTARAERFERDCPVPPAYTWTVPEKPVAVRIPLTLIETLEHESVASYRSLTSRGSEIGGLLFGSVAPGNPAVVQIDSYEAVPCEYAAGPLYRLSGPELARLDRTIEQRRAAGATPVGYYRSHTRKGLSLDAGDLAILDSRFAGAYDIALLIRPSATKASVAGIFIREDGRMRGEASYLEFPFRAPQHDRPKTYGTAEGAVAGPRTVPAAPAAPLAPRPVVRAQIVPIASRREITPMPADDPIAPEPMASDPDPPSPPPQPAAAAGPPPAPLLEAPAAPGLPAEPSPAPPAAASENPPAQETPSPGAAPRRSARLAWLALGVLASLALAAGFLFTSGVLHPPNLRLPATAPEAGLALRVERNAGDILLTWNRDADSIKRATHAVLSISDGPQQENVEMDLSQLRNGSIVYSPVTSDVVFRMEVAGGQSQPVSETVRVLRTRPSPMPELAVNAPGQAPAGSKPSAPASTESPDAEPPAAPPPEEKVALAQPVKPFRPESLAQRLRPAEIPDAPSLGSSGTPTVADVNLGGIISTPIAPPPAPATKGPAAVDQKPATVGGQIQQAVLLRRVNPEYPKLARQSGANGEVELVATIGVDGRVKTVQFVRGHPLLRQASIDAVKQWVYRPTLLNGKPVESETRVILNFQSER